MKGRGPGALCSSLVASPSEVEHLSFTLKRGVWESVVKRSPLCGYTKHRTEPEGRQDVVELDVMKQPTVFLLQDDGAWRIGVSTAFEVPAEL